MHDSIVSAEVLTRFIVSLFGSPLASSLRITPAGLFVPEVEKTKVITAYQNWLKIDSGAAGLLEDSRCMEHLFEQTSPTDYYILDGKNCLVGNLIKVDPSPEIKNKFPIYAGTPIDGRKSIHPKDPILSNLPEGVQIQTGKDGMEVKMRIRDQSVQIPLSRLQDLAYLIGNSPRLRKQRHTFKQSLRKVVPELAILFKQARIANSSSLRFLPSQFRRQSNVKFITLADLVFAFNSRGDFISGFGFKAKNLLDFIHTEIKILSQTVRSKRIAEFELRSTERNSAGLLRAKNEKFSLDYRALMDFVQIWRPNKSANSKVEAPTLFDILRELSTEFSKSAWTLDRDISTRYRGSAKDNLNYRTTKGWVFWISKRSQLVSLRRRPIIEARIPILIKPNIKSAEI